MNPRKAIKSDMAAVAMANVKERVKKGFFRRFYS